MHIVLIFAVISNVLSLIMFLFGLFYNFKQPKIKAVYGYLIAACMIFYIIIFSLVLICEFFKRDYIFGFILFLCIISHFIIGKLVKYETLKIYTTIQIMCYVVSLITLLLNF